MSSERSVADGPGTAAAPSHLPDQPPPRRFDAQLRSQVHQRLAGHPIAGLPADERRPAAVAIALCADPAGDACFLLTRRTGTLRAHRHQWALPGGRLDPGEDAEAAACRELAEEVGVTGVEVLGRLDDYPTRSGYRITPVVVWVPAGTPVTADPREVASVHHIALRELDRQDGPSFLALEDATGPVIQLPIGDHLIHAPTAAVLYQFAEVGLRGRATRVAHFDEPHFARR